MCARTGLKLCILLFRRFWDGMILVLSAYHSFRFSQISTWYSMNLYALLFCTRVVDGLFPFPSPSGFHFRTHPVSTFFQNGLDRLV